MGGNDLMMLDLETLQAITAGGAAGEKASAKAVENNPIQPQKPPSRDGSPRSEAGPSAEPTPQDPALAMHTETVPDLAKVLDAEQTQETPALTEDSAPKCDGAFPRMKRQFTLREEHKSRRNPYESSGSPAQRYGGAGVYSMPVRYSGEGRFEKGRDNPGAVEPEPMVIETSEFELANVERQLKKRRGDD
ncbi:MAG: hypothetical protein AAFQ82_28405 [Myxococcota bacterium]